MAIEDLERFVDESVAKAGGVSPFTLRERYRGVMLGIAAGNALGLATEGLRCKQIATRFPGGLVEVDPREKGRPWDDDLAQTVLLAEALLDREELNLGDVALRLIQWRTENGRGIGNLTAQVIGLLALGYPASEAARSVWENRGRNAAGNGAVMRCAPVALKWRQSGHHLVEESIKSSLITHYDPRCVWSVVAANCVIALILNASTPDCEKLVAALDSAGAPANVGAAIRDSQKCNLEALVLDGPDMGYTLKALQVGFWALQQGDDYENLLVEVVNAGGDTDTNGAVAGAVMGARHGLSAIPKRWVEHIRDTGRLIALADRLFETCRSS